MIPSNGEILAVKGSKIGWPIYLLLWKLLYDDNIRAFKFFLLRFRGRGVDSHQVRSTPVFTKKNLKIKFKCDTSQKRWITAKQPMGNTETIPETAWQAFPIRWTRVQSYYLKYKYFGRVPIGQPGTITWEELFRLPVSSFCFRFIFFSVSILYSALPIKHAKLPWALPKGPSCLPFLSSPSFKYSSLLSFSFHRQIFLFLPFQASNLHHRHHRHPLTHSINNNNNNSLDFCFWMEITTL